jgi:hypothetical protein
LGGKMLVGGDVTSFFLGLMGVLSEALRAGRLPVWNHLWGYGFPGLAESQMGVFYPIHVILYRWLHTETAYVVSLMFHTLWGGLGAFWAARRLGISSAGSGLAAFCWTTCGFFLIHLAHPWGYTAGCWMPWAWGLAWSLLFRAGPGSRVGPFLLSLVLVLQVLPGHFQLAFLTQFGIALMLLWALIERAVGRAIGGTRPRAALAAFCWRRGVGVALAIASVFPLAAIQLWPTFELARMAVGLRDPGYLSDFASPPLHLVNYVAPGLFHRSPLWRPLVWDPFHAMPEEHLPYIGLVPLLLACMTALRQWRADGAVRFLTLLAAVTLVLSLGPFAPGFQYLIRLPGFSFFRAPARWSLATALALALLAGKGFDCWRDWTVPGRSLRRGAVAAVCWVAAVVGLLELALASTARPGWPAVTRRFEQALSAMPWGDPGFLAVMELARRSQPDPRLPVGLARSSKSFAAERGRIYTAELGESAVLLAAILLVAVFSERSSLGAGTAKAALVVLTFLDLWVLGRHRLLDVGPLRPLVEQSPVLARLGAAPRGTRIANGSLRNLPMLAGLAPISAYRTLDLPAVASLTAAAQGPLTDPRSQPEVKAALRATGASLRVLHTGDNQIQTDVKAALRATGTSLRVFDPIENQFDQVWKRESVPGDRIEDAALASWLFGASWVGQQKGLPATFLIWSAPEQPARAWLVLDGEVADPEVLDVWSGDHREILGVLRSATPLPCEQPRPEDWTITLSADAPAWVIISQLADPQWTARWIKDDDGVIGDGEIVPTFRKPGEPGGWQRVKVPGAGRWTLRLEYQARDLAFGTAVSTLAWASWLLAALRAGLRRRKTQPVSGRDQTEA